MPAPDADLTFDLELAANFDQAPVEPIVAFAAGLHGGQFQLATLQVVDNLPPIVRITAPANGANLPQAPTLSFTVETSDPLGGIERVELFTKDGMNLGAPTILLGTATTPPYIFQATGLDPGHWMVWAVAYDTQGGSSSAAPIHIGIDYPHH